MLLHCLLMWSFLHQLLAIDNFSSHSYQPLARPDKLPAKSWQIACIAVGRAEIPDKSPTNSWHIPYINSYSAFRVFQACFTGTLWMYTHPVPKGIPFETQDLRSGSILFAGKKDTRRKQQIINSWNIRLIWLEEDKSSLNVYFITRQIETQLYD